MGRTGLYGKEWMARFPSTCFLHLETKTQAIIQMIYCSEGFLLFCFFNLTERNFHIFQISSVPLYCLITTLQLASHWLNLSVLFICTQCPRGGDSGRPVEQLRFNSVENPEAQMWIQIGLKNLMRSGFLGLPAF
jgi:hypothetical protein